MIHLILIAAATLLFLSFVHLRYFLVLIAITTTIPFFFRLTVVLMLNATAPAMIIVFRVVHRLSLFCLNDYGDRA